VTESPRGTPAIPPNLAGTICNSRAVAADRDNTPAFVSGDAALEYLIRFEHPDCFLREFPSAGALSRSSEAEIYGAQPDDVVAARQRLMNHLEAHVPCVTKDVSPPDGRRDAPLRILAAGDSITHDYLSWAYLLERAFDCRAAGTVRIENCAVSGATSAGVLLPLVRALSRHHDLVIVMVGTNDALYPDGCGKPLVSDAETVANLAAIRTMVAAVPASPRLMWITPPPVDPDAMRRHPIVSFEPISHRRATVEAKIEIVASQPEPVVDLRQVLGRPSEAWLIDGVHPSIEAQVRIARAVGRALEETHRASVERHVRPWPLANQ